MTSKLFWNEERIHILKTEYSKKGMVELARQLGCSVKSLHTQASKHGISCPNLWTHSEEMILHRLYATSKDDFLAKYLGRTPTAIRNKANKLGLSKQNDLFWTISQEQYLIESFNVLPIWELEEIFKKSKLAIKAKYSKLMRRMGKV